MKVIIIKAFPLVFFSILYLIFEERTAKVCTLIHTTTKLTLIYIANLINLILHFLLVLETQVCLNLLQGEPLFSQDEVEDMVDVVFEIICLELTIFQFVKTIIKNHFFIINMIFLLCFTFDIEEKLYDLGIYLRILEAIEEKNIIRKSNYEVTELMSVKMMKVGLTYRKDMVDIYYEIAFDEDVNESIDWSLLKMMLSIF